MADSPPHRPAVPALARQRIRFTLRHPWYAATRIAGQLVVQRLSGGRVVSGPFRGMEYRIPWPHLPALIGTYERELHHDIERVVALPIARVVVIGAADGYYAIGLARRLPDATVTAFELSPERRVRVAAVARDNSVSGRVEIRGAATSAALAENLAAPVPTLVVMDVDGAESVLLDPATVAGLRSATIIVELHDHIVPGVTELIRRRFTDTHVIDERLTMDRTYADWPADLALPWPFGPAFAIHAMGENRGAKQRWYVMHPR